MILTIGQQVMTKRIALIDGDIVAYRCGFAAEHKDYKLKSGYMSKIFDSKTAMNKFLKDHPEITEYEWESNLTVEPLEYVLSTVKKMLLHIIEGCAADGWLVCLSGSANHRDKIASIAKYKGNRDKTRRPLHHEEVIKYLKGTHHALVIDGQEADDLIADLSVALTAVGYDPVICTIDKDLQQIPGKYFSFVEGKKFTISTATAKKCLLKQILMGDGTDNVPGIAQVGPATAEKLLADAADPLSVILEQWDKYLASGRCPWINEEGKYVDVRDGSTVHYATATRVVEELYSLLNVGVAFEKDESPSEEEAIAYIRDTIPEWLREEHSIRVRPTEDGVPVRTV